MASGMFWYSLRSLGGGEEVGDVQSHVLEMYVVALVFYRARCILAGIRQRSRSGWNDINPRHTGNQYPQRTYNSRRSATSG